jgi:hypothetical protein
MRLYFSQWLLAEYQGEILTELGVAHRFLSFAETRRIRREYLEDFLTRGYVDEVEFRLRMIREAGPGLLSRVEAQRLKRQAKKKLCNTVTTKSADMKSL